MKNRIIMVTGPGAPKEMIERLKMHWAESPSAAMRKAEDMLGNPMADITVIPDGVGIIVG